MFAFYYWPWPDSGGLGDHELCALCWEVGGYGCESLHCGGQASCSHTGSCSPENHPGLFHPKYTCISTENHPGLYCLYITKLYSGLYHKKEYTCIITFLQNVIEGWPTQIKQKEAFYHFFCVYMHLIHHQRFTISSATCHLANPSNLQPITALHYNKTRILISWLPSLPCCGTNQMDRADMCWYFGGLSHKWWILVVSENEINSGFLTMHLIGLMNPAHAWLLVNCHHSVLDLFP